MSTTSPADPVPIPSPSGGTHVPFNLPPQAGDELNYVRQALVSGRISGDGAFTARCQRLLEEALPAVKVLLTTSCTHALEMAALLLDIGREDEVIVPSYTFVSTANAFVLRGARPVFVDIRPDTLNVDESRLEALITSRTKAIAVVHYAGVACEMDAILRIAERHGVAVIEDNAHGLFGTYRTRQLGTFGSLATQSFHETKNFSCGEGGALVINDERFIERAEVIREKGTNRSRFFRGEIDKYTWVDVGSSYLPSDLLAAFLLAQLEQRDAMQLQRHAVWQRYAEGLTGWAHARGVRLPIVPEECEHPSHLFYLLLSSLEEREALREHLSRRGISAPFHYVPLHQSELGRSFGHQHDPCAVSERVSDCLLRLPLYNALPHPDQDRVIEAVLSFGGVS
jgi:dTDP-4-amino-4,6-dideoxygalactose transaminase